jgi:hypothetical protein
MGSVRSWSPPGRVPGNKPTVRQIYAVARELCERSGEEFPLTRRDASELIERLRTENGKPVVHLARR